MCTSRIINDVLEVVLNAVAEFSGKSVVFDESLIDLGIDSIAAVELALTLQERFGLRSLDVANIASCQTPMAMAQSLCSEIDKSKCIQKSETNVILSNPVHDQTQRSTNREVKNHELKVLLEKVFTRPATLFLGAPAFGDGQLAYMRLVSSLYLGAHPVLTLERNSRRAMANIGSRACTSDRTARIECSRSQHSNSSGRPFLGWMHLRWRQHRGSKTIISERL